MRQPVYVGQKFLGPENVVDRRVLYIYNMCERMSGGQQQSGPDHWQIALILNTKPIIVTQIVSPGIMGYVSRLSVASDSVYRTDRCICLGVGACW